MAKWLDTPLCYLPGVGERRAKVFASELNIHTCGDLLHYYPYRYVDRSRFYKIRELNTDMPYIQLKGYIRDFMLEGNGRKQRLVASFYDGTGTIELLWFKGLQTIEKIYQLGREYIIFGKPSFFNGRISLVHPEIDDIEKESVVAGGLVPLYNSTEKLKNTGISNRQMRQILQTLLERVQPELHESLPIELHKQSQLMAYRDALMQVHFPTDTQNLEQARRRLKVEELLLIQLKMQREKLRRKESYQGIALDRIGEQFNKLYKNLPFDLTSAQKRVLKEIRTDVLSGQQMNRLVQGDVGSGKTLVALFAMLMAVDSGYQACLMAPTEILARQHYNGLSELLAPLGIEVALMIGSTTKRQRATLLPRLERGEIPIVVGTHALLEEGVQFCRLAMAVIDEQHRFGVQQRSRLWTKTNTMVLPHILIMSATPIPRTLAMTLYGDLDISIIDELPPGRQAIQTYHQTENEMYKVYNFMRQEIMKGRQVYVVFPMIEENEHQDLKDLESGLERYRALFPEYPIAYIHGKMKAKDKDERMQEFVSGKAKILLATTVIEVGVNVPNASIMIIEGANRFGLSQLHQLRGRVGRGSEQSYCILVTGFDLGTDSRRRIEIMCETNDGFIIAEEDMRLRGFGELEGTRQSGKELTLRIANPAKDGALVQYCRDLAERILATDANLSHSEHSVLRERLHATYNLSHNWAVIS